MTSEDKEKLRFYVEQIAMKCGTYGFFVTNGFYIKANRKIPPFRVELVHK